MLGSTHATIQYLQSVVRPAIHTTALGCLDAYFRLAEDLDLGKSEVLGSAKQILYLQRRHKTYVFNPETLTQADIQLLEHFQQFGPIYSAEVLPLPKQSAFKELMYHLPNVFHPASYPNSKKRHSRIVYPFKWLANQGIEVSMHPPSNETEIRSFHDAWVAYKLADEKTYQIMFPQKRYIRCFERLQAEVPGINYQGFFFYLKGKLVSVRIISIYDICAYDLANFTNTWDCPSQLSNYCDVWVLRELHLKGFLNFNCGAVLNKNLQVFKSHYPHALITSYMYGKTLMQQPDQHTFL